MLARRDTQVGYQEKHYTTGAKALHGSTIKLLEKINMVESIGESYEKYMDDVEHLFVHQPSLTKLNLSASFGGKYLN